MNDLFEEFNQFIDNQIPTQPTTQQPAMPPTTEPEPLFTEDYEPEEPLFNNTEEAESEDMAEIDKLYDAYGISKELPSLEEIEKESQKQAKKDRTMPLALKKAESDKFNPDSYTSKLTKELATYKQAYANGEITKEEYDKLIDDFETQNPHLTSVVATLAGTAGLANMVFEAGGWLASNTVGFLASVTGWESVQKFKDEYLPEGKDYTPDIIKKALEQAKEYEEVATNDPEGGRDWMNTITYGLYESIPTISAIELKTAQTIAKGGLISQRFTTGKARVIGETAAASAGGFAYSYGKNEDVGEAITTAAFGAATVLGLEGLIHIAGKNVAITGKQGQKKIVKALEEEAFRTNKEYTEELIKDFKTITGKDYHSLPIQEKFMFIVNQSEQGIRLFERMAKDADTDAMNAFRQVKQKLYESADKATEEGKELLVTEQVKALNKEGKEIPSNMFYKWFQEAGGTVTDDMFEAFSMMVAGKEGNLKNAASALNARTKQWLAQHSGSTMKVTEDGLEPYIHTVDVDIPAFSKSLSDYMRNQTQGAVPKMPMPTMDKLTREVTTILQRQLGTMSQDVVTLKPEDMLNVLEEFRRSDIYKEHAQNGGEVFNKQVSDFLIDIFSKGAGERTANILREIETSSMYMHKILSNPNEAIKLVTKPDVPLDSSSMRSAVYSLTSLNKDVYKKLITALPYEQQVQVEMAVLRTAMAKSKAARGSTEINFDNIIKDADKGNTSYVNWKPITDSGKALKHQLDTFIKVFTANVKRSALTNTEITGSTLLGRIIPDILWHTWGRVQTKASVLNNVKYSTANMEKLTELLDESNVFKFRPLGEDAFKASPDVEEFMILRGALNTLSKYNHYVDYSEIDWDGLDALLISKHNKLTPIATITPVAERAISKNVKKAIERLDKDISIDEVSGTTYINFKSDGFNANTTNNILSENWAEYSYKMLDHGMILGSDGTPRFIVATRRTIPKMRWGNLQVGTKKFKDIFTPNTLRDLKRSLRGIDWEDIKLSVIDDEVNAHKRGSFLQEPDGSYRITLNKVSFSDWNDALGTLSHELTHLIQTEFKLPKGKNTSIAKAEMQGLLSRRLNHNLNMSKIRGVKNTLMEMLDILGDNNALAGLYDVDKKGSFKLLKKSMLKILNSPSLSKAAKGKLKSLDIKDYKSVEDIEKAVKTLLEYARKPYVRKSVIGSFLKDFGGFAAYLRHMGEVDARLVQDYLVAKGVKPSLEDIVKFHARHRDAFDYLAINQDLPNTPLNLKEYVDEEGSKYKFGDR